MEFERSRFTCDCWWHSKDGNFVNFVRRSPCCVDSKQWATFCKHKLNHCYLVSNTDKKTIIQKAPKISKIPNNDSWIYPSDLYMGVSKNRGTPKWMVKIMEIPIKTDDLGVPLFSETSTSFHRFPLSNAHKLRGLLCCAAPEVKLCPTGRALGERNHEKPSE